MNLNGRVTALERAATAPVPVRTAGRERLIRRLADLAERLHGAPAPPIEKQSPAEQTVRAGLAAIEGVDDPRERARRFWSTVTEQLRAWDRRRTA